MRGTLLAIVDTGSPYCLFDAGIAKSIGITDITTGQEGEIGSAKVGVKDVCYFHKIKLYVEALGVIDIKAGFSANLSVQALLGRYGFFDHYLVTFDHSGNPPMLEVTKIDRVN